MPTAAATVDKTAVPFGFHHRLTPGWSSASFSKPIGSVTLHLVMTGASRKEPIQKPDLSLTQNRSKKNKILLDYYYCLTIIRLKKIYYQYWKAMCLKGWDCSWTKSALKCQIKNMNQSLNTEKFRVAGARKTQYNTMLCWLSIFAFNVRFECKFSSKVSPSSRRLEIEWTACCSQATHLLMSTIQSTDLNLQLWKQRLLGLFNTSQPHPTHFILHLPCVWVSAHTFTHLNCQL